MRALIAAALAASVAVLSGCATHKIEKDGEGRADRIAAVVNAIQTGTADKIANDVPLYARVNGLWVSERTIKRSPGDALPPTFSRPFVYRSILPLTLNQFVQAVQQASRANVTLVGEPQQGTGPIVIEHQGTLRTFLATGAQRFGVGYAWTESGLEIIQTEARTFPVHRPAVLLASSGNAAGATRRDPYTELETTLKVVAPRARIVVSRATNSITVVDRPSAMRDIERVMAHDTEQAQRSVMVRWQLVNFTSSQAGEAGVAVNYLMSRNGGLVNITGGSGPGNGASSLRIGITDPTATSNGSSVVLSLLNQNGRATVLRDGLISINNNSTREYYETLRVPFPAKVSLATIPALGSNTTAASQVLPVTELATEEVGLNVKMSATIHPSEEVDLDFNFELKQITRMVDFSTSIIRQQAPETAKRGSNGAQRAKHGESFLYVMDSNDSTIFDRRVGLALDETANARKEQWLLLLTPVITRGTL